MTIPENIKEIYRQQCDWQKRIEALHATESHADTYAFARGSADALQWAVAQAMEIENRADHDLFYSGGRSHLCGGFSTGKSCGRKEWKDTDWLAAAEAKLMEPVKEKSDGE